MVAGRQTALANHKVNGSALALQSLLPSLARLDRRIERAQALARRLFVDESGEGGPRLCISAAEIDWMFEPRCASVRNGSRP